MVRGDDLFVAVGLLFRAGMGSSASSVVACLRRCRIVPFSFRQGQLYATGNREIAIYESMCIINWSKTVYMNNEVKELVLYL